MKSLMVFMFALLAVLVFNSAQAERIKDLAEWVKGQGVRALSSSSPWWPL